MGFIEFYKKKCKYHRWWTEEELPEDVKKDLWKLLENDDKRIGFAVLHNHRLNPETNELEFKGMVVGYYVRSWHPHFISSSHYLFGHEIPCGIRFWNMKRTWAC